VTGKTFTAREVSMATKTHRDLDVWKRGIDLAVAVYDYTGGLPESELYGMTSQLRRASVSVPSNIAEGAARGSTREFGRFLRMSLGSLAEVDTLLVIAERVGYQPAEQLAPVVEETRRKLINLSRSLKIKLKGGKTESA
jgi:four helix bundle protein